MNIILYSAEGSNSSERVEWVLNYKSVQYTRLEVTDDALRSSYLQINPFGYVPTLSVDEHLISESMAIIEFIEECFPKDSLLGDSVLQRARVREVCEYVNASIHSPQNRSVLTFFRPNLLAKEKGDLRGHWIKNCLAKLESRLCQTSQFSVGTHFSLADIFVASIYKKAQQHGVEPLPFYDKHLIWLRQHSRIALSEPNVK